MGTKPAVATEVTEILEDDAFAAAFDNFVDEGETKVEPEPAPKEEPVAAKVEPEPAKEEPTAPAAKVEPEVKPVTAEEIAKVVTEAVKAVTPAAPAAPAAKEEPAPAEEIDPKVAEALADLESNWNTHSLAVNHLLQQQEKKLKSEFQEILKPILEKLEPLQATAAVTAQEQFNNALLKEHPEAFDQAFQADLDKWISEQPDFMQAALDNVLTRGTAAQVSQALTQFKTATSRTAQPAAPVVDEAAKAAEAAKEKKLQKMEAPAAKRTSVTAEPDPADFDSGWEKGAQLAV